MFTFFRLLSEEEEEEKLDASEQVARTNGNGNGAAASHETGSDVIDPRCTEEEEEVNENSSSLSPKISRKRRHSDDSGNDAEVEELPPSPKKPSTIGLPGANIKIATRGKQTAAVMTACDSLFTFFVFSGNGRNGEASLVVSLEINGINYQGVLFAQPAKIWIFEFFPPKTTFGQITHNTTNST